uniref:Xyloglucan endotransglucosylase/hydrolase n=1 Tax=Equisetum fluviatile TaxID=231680 RepID=A0A7D5BPR1_EQUFL|nr:xyloglucan endo-transglycoylase/hydrolase H [Equisetum fluviatile]
MVSILSSSSSFCGLRRCLVLLVFLVQQAAAANFNQDFNITWAPDHVRVLDNSQLLQLTLDQASGSGFVSKNQYLFGNIDMQIKLVPGNSAGTVTAYYLYSTASPNSHDELDFEFLGNVSGQPYILQTNVFTSGKGEREERINLWFDPTADFHTYSILWNPQIIIFSVDGTPIRVFPNNEKALGVPYLNKQSMSLYSTLWNADGWATRGGLDKIDWTQAPFVASYTNFKADACTNYNTDYASAQACASSGDKWWNQPEYQTVASDDTSKLSWVRQNFLIYDYCSDTQRNPVPPPECSNSHI